MPWGGHAVRGGCWQAPWPTPPAAAGSMALGARRDLCWLGTVASSSAGAPLSSCRSCESFTVRRGGGPGWAPPWGAGRPLPPVHLGSRRLRRGEACSGSSSPARGELGSPGGALTASAGHHPDKLWEGTGQDRVGRKEPVRPSSGHSLQVSLGSERPPSIDIAPTSGAGPLQLSGLSQSILRTAAGPQDGGFLICIPDPSETSQAPHWITSNILM